MGLLYPVRAVPNPHPADSIEVMFGRRRPSQAPPPARGTDWRSFDSVAETYERVRVPIHEDPVRDLVGVLGPPTGGGLLDVGAGTGVLSAAALEAGWSPVVAADRSFPMLERAAQRGIPLLAIADAIDLPFRDGTFGAVASSFVLHAFQRYDTALFDMIRVLRPGGAFGAATWVWRDDEFTRTWRAVAERFATKDLLDDGLRRAAPWAERFSKPQQVEEALRDAGLRSIRVERHQYRHEVSIEEYLAGREISALGRYLRGVLNDTLWDRFREQVDQEFRRRFHDPIGDSNDVLIGVALKP
jgi:ubiquinone/menaquinone biosynthesis C-methylase UbiE